MTVVVKKMPGGGFSEWQLSESFSARPQPVPDAATHQPLAAKFTPSRTVRLLAHTSRLVDGLRAARPQQLPLAVVLTAILVASLTGLVGTIQPPVPAGAGGVGGEFTRKSATGDVADITSQLAELEQAQQRLGVRVVEAAELQQRLRAIRLTATAGGPVGSQLEQLRRDLAGWKTNVSVAAGQQTAGQHQRVLAPASGSFGPVNVPIIMYHKTPDDFENQLQALTAKGYTSIDPDQLALALKHGAPLPPKPVLITFDDGFANQMQAFSLLQRYNFKATYYIITGGAGSRFCIGANRQAGQPCGDAYLSWDEIRRLDSSGLVTIGAHTIDHVALASQNAAGRQRQIGGSKAEIEAQLGHPIRHFAYPGGSFNAETVAAVQAAGFATAVTTRAGTTQGADKLYELTRVRSSYGLQ